MDQSPPAPNQSPPSPANPYDFILNNAPQKGGKKPMGAPTSDLTKRLLVAGIGALFIVVAVVVFLNILSSSGKGGTKALVGIAAQEVETLRLAKLGLTDADSTQIRNLSATTVLTTETNHVAVLKLITRKNYVITPLELASRKNPKIDTELATAKLNNDYDKVYEEALLISLDNYRSAVKKAYDTSESKTDKAVLSGMFNGVDAILKNQLQE